MQLGFVRNGFSKIIQMCSRNGLLKFLSTENSLTAIHYGPLGTLLKRNIFREWLSSILNEPEIQMFPMEIQIPRERTILLKKIPDRSYDCLLLDVMESYFDTLPMVKEQLPFGFAVYGPCVQKNKSYDTVDHFQYSAMLRNLKAWNRTSVTFFCPSKKSTMWFHYWSRFRYRWWRKFSSIPSKFSMSEVVETQSGDQQLSLMLEFPWGKERLETITLHEEKFFRVISETLGNHTDGSKPVTIPSVITCENELDLAVLAYLTNSFAEKWRDNEVKNIFQLHVKLAPYKVCLSVDGSDSEILKKLNDVASHLFKELKTLGVSVFPIFDINPSNGLESQFYRFDEMGIPYIIVLNENSLQTGIAGLRNRDTTLQEQVHIAELVSKILKYLQVKAHESDD